ncbi:hypothetical protein [Rubinisphaera sp.]|uniref:hypothetical protein n=1 Tax=Rubinisphaera sp. TaxID=2024857 RepID=UPI000C0F4123|nr:hypothetical protein [Rubinisphaera sp.]MBV11015.1 hypothetical protein [Rubinisphaera sp.]HCS50647.1 hypothetical protein [Planctomycetaceae bacterium]|tara:strand:+ start:4761 stop:5501 length:741 start_codon:yes stop_codon:yes gene_type:complete
MSEDHSIPPEAKKTLERQGLPKHIYLVSYPKIVFMYPTVIAALVVGIWMHLSHGLYGTEEMGKVSHFLGTAFLAIFTLNMVVISFDFPRTTSLTLFFFIAAFALGGYVLLVNYPNMVPFFSGLVMGIRPVANAQFYYLISGMFIVLFLLVKIGVQFDYWEVRPNELLHHHGFLSDMERFSAPNLRIDKEINDLFEYMLLGSGRLILHPSNERRVIVLENVFFIGKKEKTITKMLGALQVQVRDDSN